MNLDVDISDADDELTRLIRGLKGQDAHEFEAVLAAQFIETQRVVHVDTMSLKRSGKMDSQQTDDKWTGDISYGGVSAGSVHDPVWYAAEERSRGGDHDFLAPAEATSGNYLEPMLQFLKGRSHGHVK